MSTETTQPRPAPSSPGERESGRDGNILQVMGSEWLKLWSLRSTGWTLLIMLVVSVGFSVLASWGTASHLKEARAGGNVIDPTAISLAGLTFGQLALAVLGVLVISGEYSTGAIKSSLTAVPQRITFLTAKVVVFTVVAIVSAIITSFVCFFSGMIFFNHHDAGMAIGDPHVLRAIIGGGLVMTVSGLLGVAIGTLLRHSAGAITITVGLLFVVPIVLSAVPAQIVQDINKYFLVDASQQVTQVIPTGDLLGPWPGFIVYAAEAVFLLVVGAVLLQRRDA